MNPRAKLSEYKKIRDIDFVAPETEHDVYKNNHSHTLDAKNCYPDEVEVKVLKKNIKNRPLTVE